MLPTAARRCWQEAPTFCIAWYVLVTVELLLFVDHHERRWHRHLATSPTPQVQAGEGLVIRVDGLQYYAWLRSLLIDGDWSFDNEFDEHDPWHDSTPRPAHRTPLGRRANISSIGPACVWSLTVVPGHFCLRGMEKLGFPYPTDGYSLPYQLLVGTTSLLVSWVGLFLLYGICRMYARPDRAAYAVVFAVLGTTVVFYQAIGVVWAHGLGTTVLAGLVYYWLTTYGSSSARRWFVVGLLVGLAALVKWNLVLYAVLPAGEWSLAIWRERTRLLPWPALRRMALAAAGALIAFSPQMIAWQCLYGSWLVVPTPRVKSHWLSPSFHELLLGQDRSLFYWTPLTAVCCLGFLFLIIKKQPTGADTPAVSGNPEASRILFGAFLLQVYARASVIGRGEVYLPELGSTGGVFLGQAYGCRFLTESIVVLAPGLAFLLESATRWRFYALVSVCALLVSWNLLLVYLHSLEVLGFLEGASPKTMWASVLDLFNAEPSTVFVFACSGPALCAVLWGWPNEGKKDPRAEGG